MGYYKYKVHIGIIVNHFILHRIHVSAKCEPHVESITFYLFFYSTYDNINGEANSMYDFPAFVSCVPIVGFRYISLSFLFFPFRGLGALQINRTTTRTNIIKR